MTPSITKRCFKCRLELPHERFSKCRSSTDGLQAKCKACAKAYRAARIEEIRERDRQYREENRDVIRTRARQRYKLDPQKYLDGNRRWAAANPDKIAANKKDYFTRNREELLAYQKSWAARNREKRREYVRRYSAKHPEMHRAVVMRVRARRAGVDLLDFSVDQIFQRMAYFGFKCWMCSGAFEHVDHVKPLSKGGPHLLANLRPACASCNATKRSRWPFPTAMDRS